MGSPKWLQLQIPSALCKLGKPREGGPFSSSSKFLPNPKERPGSSTEARLSAASPQINDGKFRLSRKAVLTDDNGGVEPEMPGQAPPPPPLTEGEILK